MQLRTVESASSPPVVHETYHDAARAQGFVTGDEEYFICMTEATIFQMGHQPRGLFVTLILDGGPAPKLWTEFQQELIEDLLRTRNQKEAIEEALCQTDLKLQLHGKTNSTLNLPPAKHRKTEHERMKAAFIPDEQTTYSMLTRMNLCSLPNNITCTTLSSMPSQTITRNLSWSTHQQGQVKHSLKGLSLRDYEDKVKSS